MAHRSHFERSPVRSPRDGRPFYCALCGLGLHEFYACEEPDCRLETEQEAKKRALPDEPEAQR